MRTLLLPYAFRMLYPPLVDVDDNLLKERWIKYMLSNVVDCTRKNWVNHWKLYSHLKPEKFAKFNFSRDIENLALDALTWLELVPMIDEDFRKQIVQLQNLMTQTPSSTTTKARAFSLWLISRQHKGCFVPISIGERYMHAQSLFTDIQQFKSICCNIWETYFPPYRDGLMKHKHHFDVWYTRILEGLALPHTDEFLVLRKTFADQFISQFETETIWDKSLGKERTRIHPEELTQLLLGVYDFLFTEHPTCEGNWVVFEWIEDLTALASLIPGNEENVIITKDVFLIIFPLWYASIFPKDQRVVNEKLAHAWPKSQQGRLIFSESILRSLLTKAWECIVPADIGLVCQEWWLVRCCDKLARISKGRGIDRKLFVSLFISDFEVDRVHYHYQTITSEYLMEILAACAGYDSSNIPSDIVEEFFLIADVRPPANASQFILPRAIFKYSFPLWAAAHYNTVEIK
jgi:hypothetical protein